MSVPISLSFILARVARAIEPKHERLFREWQEKTRVQNKALRSLMKPDDGQMGFMFDSDKPAGVVMAVNIQKLLACCIRDKARSDLRDNRVRSCAKAFGANHEMHLMASVYVDKQGGICLLEGNHRLELLRQGGDSDILINVFNKDQVSDKEFSKHIGIVLEKCGSVDTRIAWHPDAVFCNVDWDDSGHSVQSLEKRQKGPYYTIDLPTPGR